MTAADLPLYAGHNDLGAASMLAAAPERGVRGFAQVSSMVVYGEKRYECMLHGEQAPGHGRARRSRRASSRTPARCALPRSAGPWSTRAHRSTHAALLYREQGRAAELRHAVGASVVRRHHLSALPQRLRPGDAALHPYSGVVAMFRSSLERGEAPVVFEGGRWGISSGRRWRFPEWRALAARHRAVPDRRRVPFGGFTTACAGRAALHRAGGTRGRSGAVCH